MLNVSPYCLALCSFRKLIPRSWWTADYLLRTPLPSIPNSPSGDTRNPWTSKNSWGGCIPGWTVVSQVQCDFGVGDSRVNSHSLNEIYFRLRASTTGKGKQPLIQLKTKTSSMVDALEVEEMQERYILHQGCVRTRVYIHMENDNKVCKTDFLLYECTEVFPHSLSIVLNAGASH